MIDVDTMIKEVRLHTGVDEGDADWGNADILLLLNRSLWFILNRFEFREKETTTQLTTIADTYSYEVDVDFEAMVGAAILDSNGQSDKLERIAEADWQHEYNTNSSGIPQFYFRKSDNIILFPTPDDVYTINVSHLITLDDLISGNVPPIPREWHELIMLGGIERAYLRLGDLDRSNLINARLLTMIDSTVPVQAKEEEDSQLAGINIILDPTSNGVRRKRLWR